MKLYFPEITFSAAHYIPGHEKCSGIHGHTYFVRDLEISVTDVLDEVGMSIDFGLIKGYFKTRWDHRFVIPFDDEEFWTIRLDSPVSGNVKLLRYTTCEHMAEVIRADLADILSRHYYGDDYKAKRTGYPSTWIHFSLWEGPNQAVKI